MDKRYIKSEKLVIVGVDLALIRTLLVGVAVPNSAILISSFEITSPKSTFS